MQKCFISIDISKKKCGVVLFSDIFYKILLSFTCHSKNLVKKIIDVKKNFSVIKIIIGLPKYDNFKYIEPENATFIKNLIAKNKDVFNSVIFINENNSTQEILNSKSENIDIKSAIIIFNRFLQK